MTKLDGTETKTAFAARVGLTKGRISQLVAEGLPVRSDGRIDVAEGLAWIETNLDPARRNKGGAPTATTRTATLAEAKRHADAACALLEDADHTSFVDAFRDGRFFDEPGFFADRQPLIGGCSVLSPPLSLHDDGGEGRVRGELVYDARFEGAPGWVHGGFVAAVFDQVMGYVLIRLGIPTVTRWLRVDYKRPTPTERPLVCRAWEVTSEAGNTEVAAQMLDGDRVTAEGSAVFAHLDVDRFRARVGEGR